MSSNSTQNHSAASRHDPEPSLQRFEQAWLRGTPLPLEDVLAAVPADEEMSRRDLLVELVKIDLEYRARHAKLGQTDPTVGAGRQPPPGKVPPRLEDYLSRFPQLQISDELIAAEYRVRQMAGDRPTAEEYAHRFSRPVEPLRTWLAEIEREVADEFPLAPPIPQALPASPIVTIASLLDDLRENRFLKASQLNELALEEMQGQFPDPARLGQRLLEKELLTPYQIERLLTGRARELVMGAYVIQDLLGAGSFSQVFRAKHQAMNRIVALKVMRQEMLADLDAETIQRFYREVRAAGHLSHPHVVHAYDAGPTERGHFLAMEYVDGTDLSRLVQATGALPIEQASDFIRQAALGLEHACERGLVHRDIKPSNLLVSGINVQGSGSTKRVASSLTPQPSPLAPIVKIVDFGLANLRISLGGRSGSTLTREGDVMGTADYMAPEQAVDPHGVNVRADLYSLGCTFYFLLAGRPPFPGGTFIQKVERHRWEEPAPVQQLRPDIPPAIAALVHRLMAKKPEDRLQTPTELLHVLSGELPLANLSPAPIAAAPVAVQRIAPAQALQADSSSSATMPLQEAPSWPEARAQLDQRRSRHRLVVRAAILLTVLLVVAGALVVSRTQNSSAPTSHSSVLPAVTTKRPELPPLDRLALDQFPLEERKAAGHGDARDVPAGLVGIFGKAGQPGLFGMAFSPDGKMLAAGADDGSIKIWDTATGKQLQSLVGHNKQVLGVAFHPDGKILASAGLDMLVKIWDPHSGKLLDTLHEHRDGVRTVAFSPDGKWLASAGNDHKVLVWDAFTRKDVRALLGHQRFITKVEFSPDSQLLASASDDQTVRLWEPATGKPGLVMNPHNNQITCIAFSPDGKTLVSCSWDSTLKMLDVKTGRELRTCVGHQSQIGSVTYAKDGEKFASGCLDGTVREWDPNIGAITRVRTFAPPGEEFVRTVHFAADSRHLAVSTTKGTVYILRLASMPKSR